MKVIGLNGSPRSGWNTAQMVKSVLDGAKSAGADTEYVDLYKLNFRGCASCFECCRIGGESYGKCALNDDLKPLLEKIRQADALVIGSPIYFGDVTACVRALLERLLFQVLQYSRTRMISNDRRIPVRLVFTTNAPQEGFHKTLNEGLIQTIGRFVGDTEIIEANDTLQFPDYSKYESSVFNVEAKLKRHEEVFPKDLERAFNTGVKLIKN